MWRGEATTGPRVPPFREYQGKEDNGGLGKKKKKIEQGKEES